jgi:hypothetical protein
MLILDCKIKSLECKGYTDAGLLTDGKHHNQRMKKGKAVCNGMVYGYIFIRQK